MRTLVSWILGLINLSHLYLFSAGFLAQKIGRFHSCQSTGGQTTSFWSDKWPFLSLLDHIQGQRKKVDIVQWKQHCVFWWSKSVKKVERQGDMQCLSNRSIGEPLKLKHLLKKLSNQEVLWLAENSHNFWVSNFLSSRSHTFLSNSSILKGVDISFSLSIHLFSHI